MSKPAARIGDMTAHGGTITIGQPTVLIGGMPAARVGDMHVCPMVNPGVPPPPHVGGPVAMGSSGVLIGGMPAARMGDMATCAGPPDSIVMGCFTVLIGEVGSGAAGGGGGGGSSAAAAQASAATAQFDNNEATTKEEDWVEFEFVDEAGLPVSGVPYAFEDPDGNVSEGTLRMDGTARRDALSDGQCQVVLMEVSQAQWSKDTAKVGDEVKMTAKVDGFDDGTEALFQIFKRDASGPDVVVDEVTAQVQGTKVEATWTYTRGEEEREVTVPDEGASGVQTTQAYAAPQYYFEAIVEGYRARSGLLYYEDQIDIAVQDDEGNPLAGEDYILYVSNGAVRRGTLNGQGRLQEDNIPAGFCHACFPNLPNVEAGR